MADSIGMFWRIANVSDDDAAAIRDAVRWHLFQDSVLAWAAYRGSEVTIVLQRPWQGTSLWAYVNTFAPSTKLEQLSTAKAMAVSEISASARWVLGEDWMLRSSGNVPSSVWETLFPFEFWILENTEHLQSLYDRIRERLDIDMTQHANIVYACVTREQDEQGRDSIHGCVVYRQLRPLLCELAALDCWTHAGCRIKPFLRVPWIDKKLCRGGRHSHIANDPLRTRAVLRSGIEFRFPLLSTDTDFVQWGTRDAITADELPTAGFLLYCRTPEALQSIIKIGNRFIYIRHAGFNMEGTAGKAFVLVDDKEPLSVAEFRARYAFPENAGAVIPMDPGMVKTRPLSTQLAKDRRRDRWIFNDRPLGCLARFVQEEIPDAIASSSGIWNADFVPQQTAPRRKRSRPSSKLDVTESDDIEEEEEEDEEDDDYDVARLLPLRKRVRRTADTAPSLSAAMEPVAFHRRVIVRLDPKLVTADKKDFCTILDITYRTLAEIKVIEFMDVLRHLAPSIPAGHVRRYFLYLNHAGNRVVWSAHLPWNILEGHVGSPLIPSVEDDLTQLAPRATHLSDITLYLSWTESPAMHGPSKPAQ